MLVLTRKPSQQILIEGGITLTLLEVDGGRVRIGIDAPPHIRIMRGELAAEVEASKDLTWARPAPKG
jgi:carbon storage regulator